MQCGTGHYKNLMAQFSTVVEVFLQLDEQYQEVIADITQRMGAGMAKFIELEVRGCCADTLAAAGCRHASCWHAHASSAKSRACWAIYRM
jgi:hypothetical protein